MTEKDEREKRREKESDKNEEIMRVFFFFLQLKGFNLGRSLTTKYYYYQRKRENCEM